MPYGILPTYGIRTTTTSMSVGTLEPKLNKLFTKELLNQPGLRCHQRARPNATSLVIQFHFLWLFASCARLVCFNYV